MGSRHQVEGAKGRHREHSKDEMRKIATKGGARWRCIRSIEAAKKGIAERDAFGKQVTTINSMAQGEISKTLLHLKLKKTK